MMPSELAKLAREVITMPLSKSRGRPAKYVSGRDGKPVVGMSFNRSTGQYYSSHAKPRIYFGSDFDQALSRFRAWEMARKGEGFLPLRDDPTKPPIRLRLPLPASWEGPVYVAGDRPGEFREVPAVLLPTLKDCSDRGLYTLVTTDAFYAKCRDLILKDSARFAERVGIPEIAYLQDLKPPGPSVTLRGVGDLYFGKRKKISVEWRRKQKAHWKEFVDSVGVKTIREVTDEGIERYHNNVWDEHEGNGRSPTYIAHRFQAVRTILRYAMRKTRDPQQIRRVLDLTEAFEQPAKAATDPRPISRPEFQKLLTVSSPKWRAVFLLSLNAAFYPAEVADVRRAHIDLDARTLVMVRGKTGVPRIAVLWKRTVQAILEYQRVEHHQASHLFISATGRPYSANHVGRNFRRRRAEARLPDSVTFDMIRDGAYTAAVNGGASIDQARMLSGQRVSGMADHYLKRDPRMVAEACVAIEEYYFGAT